MKVPTVEVVWESDHPHDLVQVIMRVGKTDAGMRLGTGFTLAEAFERLAEDIRNHAVRDDDKRMRELLEE